MSKKLTKEECLKELRNMCKGCEYKSFTIECSCGTKEVFEELINEHFDNPPLKFEELEKGMWVWVKDKKMYKQVIKTYVREFDEIETVHVNGYYLGFEENRFYRYEVKENEYGL